MIVAFQKSDASAPRPKLLVLLKQSNDVLVLVCAGQNTRCIVLAGRDMISDLEGLSSCSDHRVVLQSTFVFTLPHSSWANKTFILENFTENLKEKDREHLLILWPLSFLPGGASPVTWDDDTGVFVPPLHGFVSSVGDGEEVGRTLVQLAALVPLDGVAAVDVHGTVRVNGHHHLSDVRVDPPLLKPKHTGEIYWPGTKECFLHLWETTKSINFFLKSKKTNHTA